MSFRRHREERSDVAIAMTVMLQATGRAEAMVSAAATPVS